MKELTSLDAETTKACLRGVCQSIAYAATDEGNTKCYQLTSHEYFRDIRGSREDYKAMVGHNKSMKPFDSQSVDSMLENFKDKVSQKRKKRLQELGAEDYIRDAVGESKGLPRKKENRREVQEEKGFDSETGEVLSDGELQRRRQPGFVNF